MSPALTILGCGSSGGVPRVAQGWGACDPANPRNNRRRCSVLLERRRKAVRRASAILDVLDEVKLALLDGGATPASLDRLMQAIRQERGDADTPALQSLLDEIETRAAVELAKLELARRAA